MKGSPWSKAQLARRVGVGFGLPGIGCVEFAKLEGRRAVSTDAQSAGGKQVGADIVGEAKALVEAAAAEEEQFELLEPLTAEELHTVRTEMPNAGIVAVMAEARKRRGRPKGSKNRRTDDFERYIKQFGQDPAITLMQIQSTAPEELVARSQMMDPEKRRLSFGDAQALRVRCAEALMPFLHGKVPVKVDATIRGVMVVEEIGHAGRGVIIDQGGDPLGIMPPDDEGGR